ncbi:AAA family ATPase [Streptomyces sp. enrichment culture]|uniref:AAA family ATPase n=1 Tax=Streptomyces sp. enrichment culture TaxID=1795815 RepID=UPI003F57091F
MAIVAQDHLSSTTTSTQPAAGAAGSITIKPDPGIDTAEAARFLGMVFGKATTPIEICVFVEGSRKPRPFFWTLGAEGTTDSGEDFVVTPKTLADAIADGDKNGILPANKSIVTEEAVNAWYVRMTTLGAVGPFLCGGRGGSRNVGQVFGFWADGDYGTLGHAKTKPGDLRLPANADEVRAIWAACGYPEPSVTWMTGGGINGLWLFDEPITIPEGTDGEALRLKLDDLSDHWNRHIVRTARARDRKQDNVGNLDRLLRLPGSVNRKSDHTYDPKAVYADYTGATYTLDELAALLPEEPQKPRQAPAQSFQGQADGDTPWAAYNAYMWAEGRFRQQLADDGWPHHSWAGQVDNLTRPDKDTRDGMSATFGHNEDAGQPKLFVFSDGAPGLLGVSRDEGGFHRQYVDPYQYFAATQFAYDEKSGEMRDRKGALSACASFLRSKGFGTSTTRREHAVPEEDAESFEASNNEIPRQRTVTSVDVFDEDEADDVDDSLEASLETEMVSDGQGGMRPVPTARARQAQLARAAKSGSVVPDELKEKDQIVFRRASAYKPKKTEWTWDTTPEGATPTSQGRIPRAMLTMAAGLPGTGKSQCAIWMTAQVTNGTLPGCFYGEPKNVVYAATEDDWERTIVPRLIAAGADLDRVLHVKVRTIEHKTVKLIVPEYASTLGEFAAENDVALVVLDPLLSHIGGSKLNANAEKDIRDALEPLVRAAARYDFTILGLSHFNKNSGNADPMERLMGSRGFSALLRALIVFAKDKDAEDDGATEPRFVLSQAKNNLGRTDMPSYSYTIASAIVPTEEGDAYVSRFVLGPESETSVEDQMANAGRSPEDAELAKDCKRWLRDFLTDQGGEANVADIKKAADKEGYSKTAVYRVKKTLKITSGSSGFGAAKISVWKLPGA